MKRTLILALCVLMLAVTFAVTTLALTDGTDCFVYDASELKGIVEKNGNLTATYVSDSTKPYIHVVSSGIGSSQSANTYVRFDFYPFDTSEYPESGFTPDVKIQDYPIVAVRYKSDIATSNGQMPINVGIKLSTTGKYERVWGLASTMHSTEESEVSFYDITKTKSYDGGSFVTSDIDTGSGAKYVRIPAWAYSENFNDNAGEYIDIYSIGFFKTAEDAEMFGSDDVYTVKFYDNDGTLISNQSIPSGNYVTLPTLPEKAGYYFKHWYLSYGVTYTSSFRVFSDTELTAVYEEYDNNKYHVYPADKLTLTASGLTSGGVQSDGYTRFTSARWLRPTEDGTYIEAAISDYNIKAKDFPIIVIGCKSDISGTFTVGAGLKYNGTYYKHKGPSATNSSSGKKCILDLNSISGSETGGTNSFSKIDRDSNISYLRISPWGTSSSFVMSAKYFDIEYIGFFRTVADAESYIYDKAALSKPEREHTPILETCEEFEFEPDSYFTRAQAANMMVKLLGVDEDRVAYKTESSFGDLNGHRYASSIAYLEKEGYLESGAVFGPDEGITLGELAELLDKVCDAKNISLELWSVTSSNRNDKIYRADAAKLICEALGRVPDANSFKKLEMPILKDVGLTDECYPYVIELLFPHTANGGYNQNEIWLSITDNNFYVKPATSSLIEQLDAEFEAKVAEVLAAESEWETGDGGRVYYVSNSGSDTNNGRSESKPLATLERVMELQSNGTIKEGDVVLLKRGDEWHCPFVCLAGVQYSAYGTGDKPRVLGSIEADNASQWTHVGNNIYKFNGAIPKDKDVGNIVFNEGEAYGQRVIKSLNSDVTLETGDQFIVSNGIDKWYFPVQTFHDQMDLATIAANEPKANLMFYHNWDEEALYLYSRNGNPGTVFDSIEISRKGAGVSAKSNNVIDNWCVKYTGGHGIGAGSCVNLTVRNCEVGFVGGSVQIFTDLTRYGNAIEIYGSCDGYYVYDNYIYQCFDCGPTVQWQGKLTFGTPLIERNIEIHDNALWDASLEVWLSTSTKLQSKYYAGLENCKIYNNLLTASGYGFKGYTHQKHEYCCFYGGGMTYANYENCIFENNKFWNVRMNFVKSAPSSVRNGLGFNIRNNVVVMTYDGKFGQFAEDLENCKGSFILYHGYNNENVKMFYDAGTFGFNDFYYELPDTMTDDPYAAHMDQYAKTYKYGDVDNDGNVEALDVIVLSRYLAKWTGYYEQVYGKTSDLSGDEMITTLDAVILARRLAGWKGYVE